MSEQNAIFISADFPEEIDHDWDVDVTENTVSMKVQAARYVSRVSARNITDLAPQV